MFSLGLFLPSSWKFTGKTFLGNFVFLERKLSVSYLTWCLPNKFSLTSGCNSVGFRFQPSLSGAVNLCPAPNLSLTNGSASDVFRVIDSSVYKNVKAREAFKPYACVQLLLQLSLSLSLARRSVTPGTHCRIMLLIILLSSCGNAI